jgi:Ca2+-binding RTX toxin-like protein
MAGNGWQSQFPEHYPDNLTEYSYGWTATPMAFDIAAIQIIYGANITYRTGNDTYSLPNGGFGTSWSCIWDAGGVDEITNAGYGNPSLIDLRAATLTAGEGGGGFVSYGLGVVGGFTIAYGVVIENATGGNANDTLIGNDANNVLTGNAGADTLFGGNGADTLDGGADADTLDGGTGNDSMSGGAGNDVFIVDSAGDRVSDSAGTDTILLRTGSINLAGVFVENVTGDITGLAFSITGNSLANVLTGGALADAINASTGNDTIFGGDGNDSLVGGTGLDQFVFNTALGSSNVDTILGYSVADDTILLDNAVFTTFTSEGALSAGAFATGASATEADDRIIFNGLTGALLYDADGVGAGAAIQFATLSGLTGTLNAAEFIII